MSTDKKTPRPLLEEILQAVAALTPEQLVAPEEERAEDEEVIGHCDDYLKRLFTLFFLECTKSLDVQSPQQETHIGFLWNLFLVEVLRRFQQTFDLDEQVLDVRSDWSIVVCDDPAEGDTVRLVVEPDDELADKLTPGSSSTVH